MKSSVHEKSYDLKRDDYEFYRINIPVSVFLRRDRKRYVYSELGKMHPCFSEDWTFDSRLKIGKKGIEAKVLVLEKKRLAEFRMKNPLKSLKIEGSMSQSFFIPLTLKALIWGTISIVVIVSGNLILFGWKDHKNKVQNQEYQKKIEMNYEEIKTKEIEEQFEQIKNLVKEKKGTFRYFLWQTSNGTGSIRIVIKGIYPEELDLCDIEDFQLVSVAYEGESPLLQLDSNYQENRRSLEEGKSGNENYPRGEVRKIIQEGGGTILEESIEPNKIRFSCNEGISGNVVTIVQQISELISNKSISFSKIRIERGTGEIIFSSGRNFTAKGKILLELLDVDCFENHKKEKEIQITKESAKKEKKNLTKKTEDLELKNVKKIGEVRHKDGSVYLFFKTENGKIETRRIK